MNSVLMLCHNGLELTKSAVRSVMEQDLPCWLYCIDNDSSDGTFDFLRAKRPRVIVQRFSPQLGVSAGWNRGLDMLFRMNGDNHVLVLNNDVVIPPWFYRELLRYNEPFVTGVAVDDPDAGTREQPPERMPLHAAPDFSAFLIRKSVWETVGKFDERMVHYASDCDLHVRAHRAGIPMWKANAPFFHHSSSTLRLAANGEREQIQAQANADRAVFQSLYGTVPGTPEYGELFK